MNKLFKVFCKIALMALAIMFMQGKTAYAASYVDVKSGATAIGLENIVSGNFIESDYENYYMITTPRAGKYKFYMKDIDVIGYNYQDLRMAVYDTDGTEITNFATYEGSESSMIISLKQAKYYFYVYSPYSYTGNYKIQVSYVNEVPDEKRYAKKVDKDKKYTSTIENGKTLDIDYYKIKVSKAGKYTFWTKDIDIDGYNYQDIQMHIFEKDDTEIYTLNNYKGNSNSVTLQLKKGTYYFYIIAPYNYDGSYSYKVSKVNDITDTKKNAKKIKLNKKYTEINNVCVTGDKDYYKLKVTKHTNYTFWLKDINVSGHNYDDLHMYLYKSDGTELIDLSTYKGKTNKIKMKLKKGTYYICITSPYKYGGKYSFKVKTK